MTPKYSLVGVPAFDRYVGIDYSGAQVPSASLKGLRVYIADRTVGPCEVYPPPSPRRYWSRREIAEWLAQLLSEDLATLVGIAHGFSFPLQYFHEHRLRLDWSAFLDDFQRHWPTDDDNTYVDFVSDGLHGDAAARSGSRHWRRLTEVRAGAKSVFLFAGQGARGKPTHAGLPWLRYIRRLAAGRIHFWPFDGWSVTPRQSAMVEVYPTLWNKSFPRQGRESSQQDAYSIARWMQRADGDGSLAGFFNPSLEPAERLAAEIEGWILGVA